MKHEELCPECGLRTLSQWDDLMTARRCIKCGYEEERGQDVTSDPA